MAFLQKLLDTPIEDFLPKDLRVAVTPLEKNVDACSDSAKDLVSWTKNRHAIYLGKWPRPGKKTDSIYTDDAALALVDYAHAQNPEGQVQIVLGPQLSEWFNGEPLGDGTDYFSPEEQKAHLQALIVGELRLRADQFEIVFWKDEPAHRGLFERIETLDNDPSLPVGPITPEALFEGFEPKTLDVQSPDFSAQVAFLLWKRALSDSAFKAKILNTVPGKFCSDSDPDAAESHSAYGLCEIALRVADLVQGRPIQLGVGRQAIYDKVILDLLKEANPGAKQVHPHPDLSELYPLLKGKKLRAIHLKTNVSNPITLKRAREAAQERVMLDGARLTVGLSCFLAVGHGAYDFHKRTEAAKMQGRVDDLIVDCSQNLDFGPTIDSVTAFTELTNQLLDQASADYGVEENEVVRAWAVDYLCVEARKNDQGLELAYQDPWQMELLAQDFVQANRFSLELEK